KSDFLTLIELAHRTGSDADPFSQSPFRYVSLDEQYPQFLITYLYVNAPCFPRCSEDIKTHHNYSGNTRKPQQVLLRIYKKIQVLGALDQKQNLSAIHSLRSDHWG